MYLFREYFKAKVYTIWVHGPLGYTIPYCRGIWQTVSCFSAAHPDPQFKTLNPNTTKHGSRQKPPNSLGFWRGIPSCLGFRVRQRRNQQPAFHARSDTRSEPRRCFFRGLFEVAEAVVRSTSLTAEYMPTRLGVGLVHV